MTNKQLYEEGESSKLTVEDVQAFIDTKKAEGIAVSEEDGNVIVTIEDENKWQEIIRAYKELKEIERQIAERHGIMDGEFTGTRYNWVGIYGLAGEYSVSEGDVVGSKLEETNEPKPPHRRLVLGPEEGSQQLLNDFFENTYTRLSKVEEARQLLAERDVRKEQQIIEQLSSLTKLQELARQNPFPTLDEDGHYQKAPWLGTHLTVSRTTQNPGYRVGPVSTYTYTIGDKPGEFIDVTSITSLSEAELKELADKTYKLPIKEFVKAAEANYDSQRPSGEVIPHETMDNARWRLTTLHAKRDILPEIPGVEWSDKTNGVDNNSLVPEDALITTAMVRNATTGASIRVSHYLELHSEGKEPVRVGAIAFKESSRAPRNYYTDLMGLSDGSLTYQAPRDIINEFIDKEGVDPRVWKAVYVPVIEAKK